MNKLKSDQSAFPVAVFTFAFLLPRDLTRHCCPDNPSRFQITANIQRLTLKNRPVISSRLSRSEDWSLAQCHLLVRGGKKPTLKRVVTSLTTRIEEIICLDIRLRAGRRPRP